MPCARLFSEDLMLVKLPTPSGSATLVNARRSKTISFRKDKGEEEEELRDMKGK